MAIPRNDENNRIAPQVKPRKPPFSLPPAQNKLARLEQKIKHLEQSRDLTRDFVATTDMQKLMSSIFDKVISELHAEAGSLWLVDWQTKENICQLAEGPNVDNLIGRRLPAGKGIVGDVIQTGDSVIIANVADDDRFSRTVDDKTGFITQSMICVPLVLQPHTYGAIQILNKQTRQDKTFESEDLRFLEDLAMGAAISIKNVRLIQTESKIKELNSLLEISQHITKMLDLDHVLTTVVNMANELADFDLGVIAIMDEKKQELFLAEISGGEKVDPEDPNQQALLDLMEQVRQADRSVYIADVNDYKKQIDNPAENAWITYLTKVEKPALWFRPLSDEEATLGVIGFVSAVPGFANGTKADMLSILANQATVAMRNASLYSRIPFANALGAVGERGRYFISSWRKWVAITASLMVLVAAVHYLPVFRTYSGPCTVEAKLGQGVFLSVPGVVKEVYVRQGSEVEFGQPLARLDEDTAKLQLVEMEAARAGIERELIESRANNDAAAVRRLTISKVSISAKVRKARNDLSNTLITAPRSGRILTTRPSELVGRQLNVGDEILRLVNLERPTIVIEIEEEAVLDLREGQEVLTVLKSRPGDIFRGRLTYIGRTYHVPTEAVDQEAQADMAIGGFIAEAVIMNADGKLFPGMTGSAKIMTPQSSPVARLLRRIKNTFVFWFGI